MTFLKCSLPPKNSSPKDATMKNLPMTHILQNHIFFSTKSLLWSPGKCPRLTIKRTGIAIPLLICYCKSYGYVLGQRQSLCLHPCPEILSALLYINLILLPTYLPVWPQTCEPTTSVQVVTNNNLVLNLETKYLRIKAFMGEGAGTTYLIKFNQGSPTTSCR